MTCNNSDIKKSDEQERPSTDSELGRFAKRVREVIGEESVRSFSRRSGLSETALRAYLGGSSDAGRMALLAIAKTAGVRLEWLATGEEPMRPPVSYNPAIGAEFTLIQRHGVDAAAGASQPAERENEIAKLAFRQDWLRQKGLQPSDLALIHIKGDAMAPTLRDGALALIDCRRQHEKPKTDGIYVILMEDDFLAKRIQIDLAGEGGLYIKNDNPAYTEQRLDAAAADRLWIVGRVIWAGGEL